MTMSELRMANSALFQAFAFYTVAGFGICIAMGVTELLKVIPFYALAAGFLFEYVLEGTPAKGVDLV